MFKNRSFQVKVVKDDESPDTTISEKDWVDTAELVWKTTSYLALGAMAVAGTYMVGDTIRQIAVHTAVTKIK